MGRLSSVVMGLLAVGAMGLGGCAGGTRAASGDTKASDEAFAKIKTLAGEWEMTDEQGKNHTALVVSVGSGGSAVREIMFPGNEHEMTNMYHCDGGSIVFTHYCAVGNQPRMRAAAPKAGSNAFDFRFENVSNLRPEHETYMGSMVLTIVDPNTITQDWVHYRLDGSKGGEMTLKYKRKGS